MKNKKNINLFEAFAWIWSQHQALKELWYNVNVIWISEWYIDALIWYSKYHLKIKKINKKFDRLKTIEKLSKYTFSNNSKTPLKNINKLSNEKLNILEQIVDLYWELDINKIKWEFFINKNVDIFTYSFPCQDISQQGKQKWFQKELDTRSWLLWQIERILNEIKKIDKKSLPKVLVMENVKALITKKFKSDLNSWIKELNNLWYITTKPFIINSSFFWEAQNRERVFMLSFLKIKNKINKINEIIDNLSQDKINFELEKNKKWVIADIFEKNMKHDILKLKKWVNIKHNINKTNKWIKKWFLENYSSFNSENYFYYLDWQSPTITSSGAQSRIKVFNGKNILFLNWFEHLKLQWFINKKVYQNLKDIWISEQRIKFLAWNSINIKVLKYIFSKIKDIF